MANTIVNYFLAGRRLVLAVAAASSALGCSTESDAADAYSWSPNVVVAQPPNDRQQGETALAKDAKGRVWLAFIDAQYRLVASTGNWIDWPRRVRLFVSDDRGKTFSARPDLGEPAGDQTLAADSAGRVFATYVQYFQANARMRQHIALRRLDIDQPVNTSCLSWDEATSHDQSSFSFGIDGSLHLIGVDIGAQKGRGALLYARSVDDGLSCIQAQRLASVGELPQVVETAQGLMIVGPDGFYTSEDHGVTFSERHARSFGEKLVRVTVSPDRKRVYVLGDAVAGGPLFSTSVDGGRTWFASRVKIPASVRASRYPAIRVSEAGRVHIVWMDDRTGSGALYHAYSQDSGAHFSTSTVISDARFVFPSDAPPPPPATQNGTWIGDYLAITTIGEVAVVAWSDQRSGTPNSVVRTSIGNPQ